MKLSRRSLLKSGAAAAVLVVPAIPPATAMPALVVFDSRHPASRALAKGMGLPTLDISREDANFWRGLRGVLPAGAVIGLTGWSDFVIARGMLEEKGRRLVEEVPYGALFRWKMV